MADYIIVNNYSKLGKIGISRKAIVSLTEKAVESIPGVSLKRGEEETSPKRKETSTKKAKKETPSKKVSIEKPIKVALRKDGKAEIQIEVVIDNGLDIGDTCIAIQKAVSESMQISCESIPFSVNIKLARIG